jgi:hypothetical protein
MVAAVVDLSINSGSTVVSSGDGAAARLVSASLPAGSSYWFLDAVGDKLVLSGGPDQQSLLQSGNATSLRDGRAVGVCESAVVNPRTLKLGDVMRANCGDPSLYHEHVLPLAYQVHSTASKAEQWRIFVRIATADPDARDGYKLGPVLMSYVPIAGVSAEWLYGDGSLWLYAPGNNPHYTTVLLQISTKTGRVLQRWTVPALEYPVLTADDDGLWLAPSVDDDFSSNAPRTELRLAGAIYRITPGIHSPKRVMNLGHNTVRWMLAAGHTVWLESYLHGQTVQWLRLESPVGKVTTRVKGKSAGPQGANSSMFPYGFALGAHQGIYELNSGRTGQPDHVVWQEHIVWQDPQLDLPRSIKTVQPPAGTPTWAISTAVRRGAFYFLNPPVIPGSSGYSDTHGSSTGLIYRLGPLGNP